MKLISYSQGMNEESFEPYLELTVRLPLNAMSDTRAIVGEDEMVQILGTEMVTILEQVKEKKEP